MNTFDLMEILEKHGITEAVIIMPAEDGELETGFYEVDKFKGLAMLQSAATFNSNTFIADWRHKPEPPPEAIPAETPDPVPLKDPEINRKKK